MERLYTIPEVADILRVTRQTVYRWVEEGQIETIYAGAHRRVTREQVEAFLARSTSRAQVEQSSRLASRGTIDANKNTDLAAA